MERKAAESMENAKMGMTETWMRKHDLLFIAATRNPFTQAIRDAALHLSSFNNWLGQEYWLAKRASIPFLTTLLQKARQESDNTNDIQVVIQTGLDFQNDQISWLEREAEKLHVSLDSVGVVPYQPTIDYSKLLDSLTSPEFNYTAALSILWAKETVYHRTFSHCLSDDVSKTPEEMKEACRRWGGEAFGDYCLSLQSTVDRALEKAPSDVIVKAEVALLQFLEIAVQFWNVNMRCIQPNAF